MFDELIFRKRFCYYKHNSKKSSSLPNYAKLRIHVIDELETDFVMAEITAISSVANTIKKFHIQPNLHFINKKNSIMINKGKWFFFMNTISPY